MTRKHLKNQRGGAKTDTMVKLILVFFVSLLSFSVGTFVGKQFSDSQHKLAALEQGYDHESEVAQSGESNSRTTASVEGEHMEVEPSEVLSKEEVAKLAEEFVQEDKHEVTKDEKSHTEKSTEHSTERDVAATHPEENHGAAKKDSSSAGHDTPEMAKKDETTNANHETKPHVQAGSSEAEHKEKPTLKTVSDAAHKIAEGKPALDPVQKPVAPKKIELPKVTATDVQGKYTIQISSHQNETDAKTHAADLVGKGYSAFYIPAKIDGKTWYRVSVGNFTTADSAKDYLSKVKSSSSFKDAIVRKVVQ